MLDAIEARYLAQKCAATGSSGPQTGCSGDLTAGVEFCAQKRPPLAPLLALSAPQAGTYALGPANTQSASQGALVTGEHAGSWQPRYLAAMQPQWQQPMQNKHSAPTPGTCGAYSLPGFRAASTMDAPCPRSSMHQLQAEQLHYYSATALGAETGQGFLTNSSAQQGPSAASVTAHGVPSHPCHPPLSRHGAANKLSPRVLWEPGGTPQQAAAGSLVPHGLARPQQPQRLAHLRQPADSQATPPHPLQAAQTSAKLPVYPAETTLSLQAGSRPESHPMQARLSARAPPAAKASRQHGSMASMPPHPIGACTPDPGTAAAEMQTDAPSTVDADEGAAAPAEAHQEPMQEHAAAFSIEWDDWHPVEDWPDDPAEQSDPFPGSDQPGADVERVQDSLGDDEEPAHAAGNEPDLTPCTTATKGMQLDRWQPCTPVA